MLVYEKMIFYLPGEQLATNKKPPCFYVCVLITHKIMHSKDVQCNTKESP